MVFAWVGVHTEGLLALDALLAAGAPIRAVITLRPDLAAAKSYGANYAPLCARHGVPLHHVANINDPDAQRLLGALEPDVVFVIGWHQIVRPETLRLAKLGMIGAHASLLPHGRGSAPINWAVIRGEAETGNTLFWLAEELDAGDMIDQAAFPISPYDTCASLYQRVAESNRDMLLRLLPRLLAGQRPGRPQPRVEEPPLRRRRPADGRIDWRRPSGAVYDFVRALTRPYPGAFGTLEGRRWLVWHAALPPCAGITRSAGEVVGPVVSPLEEACGQLVACGEGSLLLLELEGEDGTVLRGRALSDQQWSGRRWEQ
jgi:methionyl-tRNA formyltransferase